jgi:hypothetical protein
VDPTPKTEPVAVGGDVLPAVLPIAENLLPPFAPTRDQPWLTITGIADGMVCFTFTENNTVAPRTAHLTVLGQSISITQPGNGPNLTGSAILPGGQFQFTDAPPPGRTPPASAPPLFPASPWCRLAR